MPPTSRTRSEESWWRRLLKSIAGSMEMPADVVLDVPRATLFGSMQIHIENHKGILEYSPARVRVATRDGALVVHGRSLKIGSIFRDELVVEGQIERVDLKAPAATRGESAPRSGEYGADRLAGGGEPR